MGSPGPLTQQEIEAINQTIEQTRTQLALLLLFPEPVNQVDSQFPLDFLFGRDPLYPEDMPGITIEELIDD